MAESFRLGKTIIAVTRKDVKNVHLSVHPPDGRVTLVAPTDTRLEVARAFAITKLRWIHQQQESLRGQARETPRKFVERETHALWGRNHLLTIKEMEAKPSIRLDHLQITLIVRPGSDRSKREEVLLEWYREQLHKVVPSLIQKWEQKLGVTVNSYYLQRMKTKWGSCNHRASNIRLNTELAKKPRDLLEYVVVHEMIHLIEPTHSERFQALLDLHYPAWREARQELNALPLGAV